MRLSGALLLAAVISSSCTYGFFSGIPTPDRSRPIARIETTGGVEYGATTEDGILFLGRTAQAGPCRVQYLLGPTPLVEDGVIEYRGGAFYEADIDLRHQAAPILERRLRPDDAVFAMTLDRLDVRRVPVQLTQHEDLSGDVLDWSGAQLPIGTPLFVEMDDRPYFVGLVSGELTLTPANGADVRFHAFASLDRLRETWLVPTRHPKPREIKYRSDDITVIK